MTGELPSAGMEEYARADIEARLAVAQSSGFLPPSHFIRRAWEREAEDEYMLKVAPRVLQRSAQSIEKPFIPPVEDAAKALQNWEYYPIVKAPEGILGTYWVSNESCKNPLEPNKWIDEVERYDDDNIRGQCYQVNFQYDAVNTWRSRRFQASNEGDRVAFSEVFGRISVAAIGFSELGRIHLQEDKKFYIALGSHSIIAGWSVENERFN